MKMAYDSGMISKSIEETGKIARDFAKMLAPQKSATIIALSGDLGSGKTTFAKAFAGTIGIPEETVTSPTFVIEKKFDIDAQSDRTKPDLFFKKFIHIDAYRLERPEEIERLGWRETIADPANLILIEWPENIGSAMPKNINRISFKFIDENTREIVFK